MSDHSSFENVPNMGREFGESHDAHEVPMEYDASRWEPTEELDIEQPSEKHPEMHFTPGGALEQEVHTELDEAARARIVEAQRQHQATHDLSDEKELDFSKDFENAGQHRDDVFDTGRRFERDAERERGDHDWER